MSSGTAEMTRPVVTTIFIPASIARSIAILLIGGSLPLIPRVVPSKSNPIILILIYTS